MLQLHPASEGRAAKAVLFRPLPQWIPQEAEAKAWQGDVDLPLVWIGVRARNKRTEILFS